MGATGGTRYRRRSGLEVVEVESEVSIFNGQDRTLMLNETASAIWRVLEHEDSAAGIAARLAPLYGAAAESIRPDIERTLEDLVELGVVEENRPAPGAQTAAPWSD